MGFCCVPLFSAVPIENDEQRFQFYMTFLKPLGPNQKLFPARQNTYFSHISLDIFQFAN